MCVKPEKNILDYLCKLKQYRKEAIDRRNILVDEYNKLLADAWPEEIAIENLSLFLILPTKFIIAFYRKLYGVNEEMNELSDAIDELDEIIYGFSITIKEKEQSSKTADKILVRK